METIVKEYNSWLKENQNFILHLKKHDSSLYTRIMPIYEVLNYLSDESEKNGMEFNEDVLKIFQVGLEYLYSQVDTCKIYMEKSFKNNIHDFLEYDSIVGYILYLEDLKYEMVEHGISIDEKIITDLLNYLEDLMDNKKEIPVSINIYIDSEVNKIIDVKKLDFHGIIDIFVEIAETLGLSLYSDSDFVIGKDI